MIDNRVNYLKKRERNLYTHYGAFTEQESLDWDTVNRLVAENDDFGKFLDNFMEDITVGKVKSVYDKTYTDEETAWEKFKELGILPN